MTDKCVSWRTLALPSGQTHTQTLLACEDSASSYRKYIGRESLPWLGAAPWAGVGEGVQEPLCHLGGCCTLTEEVDAALGGSNGL